MPANIVDSDFHHDFIVEDEDGVAQDVSTWTFETKIYREQTRELVFTLTDAITFNNGGTDGDCRLSLTAAQTKTLGPGNARIVIRRTDSSNRLVIGEGYAPFQSDDFDA